MAEEERDQDRGMTPNGVRWHRDGKTIELFMPTPPEPATYLLSLPWEPNRYGPTEGYQATAL